MDVESAASQEVAPSNTRSIGRVIIGVILVLPAILCCLTEVLIPTARTLLLSWQKVNLVSAGEAEFVGFQNYSHLFSAGPFFSALGFTFTFVVAHLFVAAIIPPLLGWSMSQFGRPVRWSVRLLLTTPLVLFMPVAIAVTWQMAYQPVNGLFASDGSPLANPETAPSALLLVSSLYVMGLAGAIGVMIYPPLWQRPTSQKVIKPFIVVWGLNILATLALTLPLFTLPFMMTRGGPINSTQTLGLLYYLFAFQQLNFGPAAALMTLLLAIIILLGLAAGLLIILTRLRLSLVNANRPSIPPETVTSSATNKTLPLAMLIVTLLITGGACAYSAIPYGWAITQSFGEEGFGRLFEQISMGRVVINTIIPPAIATFIQLVVAYLAGLGIGAMRPLGKYSDWLLLLFSPWLFVTILPLSLVSFMGARDFATLNTFVGLMPPILLSVPVLFIFALFFSGQSSRWPAALAGGVSSFFKFLILPSLPLAGVMLLLMLFFGWQDFIWPLLVATNRDNATLSVAAAQLQNQFMMGAGSNLVAAAITLLIVPMVLFFFIAFALAHIFYLDKLAWQTGDER
jgi:ABC-type sugar transport system permease subunit